MKQHSSLVLLAALCSPFRSVVGQTQTVFRFNFGNRNIVQAGYTGVGPTTSNTNTATTYSGSSGNTRVSVTCLGTRDYGPIVSGPWVNSSNLIRTFFYSSASRPGVVTLTGLRAGEDYSLQVFGHDTSTNNRHPHHQGEGTTYSVRGATTATRRVIFDNNGNSPALNNLASWTLRMTASSAGSITITYDRIINGVELIFVGTDSPTMQPTSAAPSPAPTDWWDHSNFSNVDARIAAVESLLGNVSQLEALTSSMSTQLAELLSLRAQVSTLNATVQQQSAVIQQVRGALLDVVDSVSGASGSWPVAPPPPQCSGAACQPSVFRSGSDVTLRAPQGAVLLETGTCGQIDPCADRQATNATLAAIFTALSNLALV